MKAFKGFFDEPRRRGRACGGSTTPSPRCSRRRLERQAAARPPATRRGDEGGGTATARARGLEEAVAGIVHNETLAGDPRRALAEEQAVTKAVRAELAAAVAGEAVAAAPAARRRRRRRRRAKAVVDEQLRARALEFGEKEMLQREIARAAERTAAAEVEREALLAEGDASRAQDAVTMAKKGGEIEALRAQAAGMAAALTKYATMEAAWVEEREEGARKLAKLKRERRELAKTAARVGDAEAKLGRRAIVLWSRRGRGGGTAGRWTSSAVSSRRRARRRRRCGRARRRRRDCRRRGRRRRRRATRQLGRAGGE